MVALALAPFATEPRVKVITFPTRALVPWVALAEMNVKQKRSAAKSRPRYDRSVPN